jgi:NhaP-type Na+/H+ or K+/H+ antiporter
MHWEIAALSIVLLAYAAISARVDGTPITAPILFTAAGLLLGVDGLGLVDPAATGDSVEVLAEAALALVLFADASRIDLHALRAQAGIPARLLGIGLPLTIVAGLATALVVLPGLAWPEALVLAVILAPTDAALGQAVVTLERLPVGIRQSLNVESGLNDGICVPIFFVALAIAEAEEGAIGDGAAAQLVAEKIGYGALAGAAAGLAGAAVVVWAGRRRMVDADWMQVAPVAAAALAFASAEGMGGSGFIAAFVGGAVFGGVRRGRQGDVSHLLEQAGDLFTAVTFVVFGAVLLGPALGDTTWRTLLYAALSLTVVRMLPVALALVGAGLRRPTVAFLGWFGPRGLASLVFAVILIHEADLPGQPVILTTVFLAVGLSVLAHGATAAPLARRYASWFEVHGDPRGPESVAGPALRWRHETTTAPAGTSDGPPPA